jgi:predicted dehydrogenase
MDLYGEKNALRVDLINHDVFLLRDYKRRYAGKAAEALMQLSVTIDNGLSSLREAVSYHSKRIHSPHQRNIRSFVASVLNGTVPPISFEDMHTLVSTQERITGLIDSYDSL